MTMHDPLRARKRVFFRLNTLALAFLSLPAGLAHAQQAAQVKEVMLPRVDVIGDVKDMREVAGSANIVTQKTLEESRVFTINEALRQVPGVHVRDEEGFGIRPNIGVRGLNPTRSTKITLLEDGIPLVYAPYGDNASYYHPQIDRYSRIEVVKGAQSLLFGPQTIGGVINYITPTAHPDDRGGSVSLAAGSRDYLKAQAELYAKGFMLHAVRKQGDGARDNMTHEINDLNLKYTTAIGARQALTLRANHYTEDSTVTYSGLTLAEFNNLGPRYNPFKNDVFEVQRTGLSATHEIEFGKSQIVTNLYYQSFDRDWWRQSSNTADTQCGAGTFVVNGVNATFANHRLAGRAVNPDTHCNSTQGRLRNYTSWGIEPRLTMLHGMGEFQAGFKAHFEEQTRRQVNGNSPTARVGTLAEDNLRDTDAYSFFVANRFDFGPFSLTPIVRHEDIEAKRTNRLNNTTGSTSLSRTLPGIAAAWAINKQLTAFTSWHKGFAPPRVEDLIGNTGTVTEVGPEDSKNFELGLYATPMKGVNLQAVYFRNDFDNLIAVGSIAGGGTPLSQGKALFQGLELSGEAQLLNGLFGRLAYTALPTAEQKTPFRRVDTQAIVGGSVAGNRQPYAPKTTLTAALGYRVGGFVGSIEAQHTGKQFTDFANTEAVAANGQTGVIAASTIWNATANYRFDKSLSGFLAVKNLTDKVYVTDRTRGIQVGQPRLVQAGVKYAF